MNRPCNDPCMGRTQIYGLSYDLCIQRKSFGVHSAMRTQKQQKCPYLINYSARISLFDKTTNLKLTTTTTKTKKKNTTTQFYLSIDFSRWMKTEKPSLMNYSKQILKVCRGITWWHKHQTQLPWPSDMNYCDVAREPGEDWRSLLCW